MRGADPFRCRCPVWRRRSICHILWPDLAHLATFLLVLYARSSAGSHARQCPVSNGQEPGGGAKRLEITQCVGCAEWCTAGRTGGNGEGEEGGGSHINLSSPWNIPGPGSDLLSPFANLFASSPMSSHWLWSKVFGEGEDDGSDESFLRRAPEVGLVRHTPPAAAHQFFLMNALGSTAVVGVPLTCNRRVSAWPRSASWQSLKHVS